MNYFEFKGAMARLGHGVPPRGDWIALPLAVDDITALVVLDRVRPSSTGWRPSYSYDPWGFALCFACEAPCYMGEASYFLITRNNTFQAICSSCAESLPDEWKLSTMRVNEH